MQQSVVAVKSKQKRTDQTRASRVTKSAYNTIGGPHSFHLYGCSAFARRVRRVEAFSDDAVKIAPGFSKPTARNAIITRSRRKSNGLC
jgi:hypothetical protein